MKSIDLLLIKHNLVTVKIKSFVKPVKVIINSNIVHYFFFGKIKIKLSPYIIVVRNIKDNSILDRNKEKDLIMSSLESRH